MPWASPPMLPSALPCTLVAWRTRMHLDQCSLSRAYPSPRSPRAKHFRAWESPSQVRQTPITTLRGLVADVGKLDNFLPTPWQKLDAVGTVLLPRLDFILKGAPNIDREYLTEADRIIRCSVQSWLNLLQRVSAEFVYIPPLQGRAGQIPLADQHNILTVAHGYHMLHASDAAVSELAHLLRQ